MRGNIITDTTEIQQVIIGDYQQINTNNSDILEIINSRNIKTTKTD